MVLPVWNGERFLTEAVESVLSQTLDTIELLLVDDGSTDATPDIAQAFARRDERVSVVRLGHGGIACALNAGVARARGQYVARMDSDDISHPSRLQKQIAYLDANADCVAVGCAIEVIDEAGERVGTNAYPEHHAGITYTLFNGWSTALAHPTVVTRREALLSVGGYRPDRFPSEDLDLWIRLSQIGKLANINEQLLRYRKHPDTVCIRDRERQVTVSAEIVNEARRRQGLAPLKQRNRSPERSRLANYHYDCARIALMTGPRTAAIKHVSATIVSEPSWLEPYAALVACAFPKWILRPLTRAFRALSLGSFLTIT